MAGWHRRILGTRTLFPGWPDAACLSVGRWAAEGEGTEVYRLDVGQPGSQRNVWPQVQRRLVAADRDAEGAYPVSGSDGRCARHPSDAALLSVPASGAAQAATARLG